MANATLEAVTIGPSDTTDYATDKEGTIGVPIVTASNVALAIF